MQHASKFQLIDTTTYLFLSISLDKVTINILTKHATFILDKNNNKCFNKTCNMTPPKKKKKNATCI